MYKVLNLGQPVTLAINSQDYMKQINIIWEVEKQKLFYPNPKLKTWDVISSLGQYKNGMISLII